MSPCSSSTRARRLRTSHSRTLQKLLPQRLLPQRLRLPRAPPPEPQARLASPASRGGRMLSSRRLTTHRAQARACTRGWCHPGCAAGNHSQHSALAPPRQERPAATEAQVPPGRSTRNTRTVERGTALACTHNVCMHLCACVCGRAAAAAEGKAGKWRGRDRAEGEPGAYGDRSVSAWRLRGVRGRVCPRRSRGAPQYPGG